MFGATIRRPVAAVTTVLLAATACAGGEGDRAAGGIDRVTYLTGFGPSAHDAFIWVADDQGYFDEAGIEADIQLGGGTQNSHALLAGQADFTYTDYTGLLVNIGSGEFDGDDFQALAAVHQHTLVAIVAAESSGIREPADLSGKLIGALAGSPTELLLPAYAERTGWELDPQQVVRSDVQGLFGLLASGQVDALSTFIIQRGVIEQAVGEPLVELRFDQVFADLLGTGIITTTALAGRDPDLVTRFRDAALAGLRYTIANPAEAIEILRSRNPAAVEDPGPFVAQIELMTPYVTAAGEDRVGVLDQDQVRRCIEALESAGLVPPALTPTDIVGEQTLSGP